MAEESGFTGVGKQQQQIQQFAKLAQVMVDRYRGVLQDTPHVADLIHEKLRDALKAIEEAERLEPRPPDSGLLSMTGLGSGGADQFSELRMPPPLPDYDEEVTSERLLGIADLYYIYQHERLGVFRAVLKLQELFKAGVVRLTSGAGALGLYQYDRQKVLRYTRRERLQAYRRVFGYTDAAPPSGSKPNKAFHQLFMKFNIEVAQFFRDQRISEVIRPEGRGLTFGSVAVVRRAGLDLRNNLKGASYGHVNVLRVEVLQLLEQAFEILGAEDVRRLFGADNAWDVIEEVLRRYLGQHTVASQRSRMATTGHGILSWLSQPAILTEGRTEFEAMIKAIRDQSEEWLTSAESVGLLKIRKPVRTAQVIPFEKRMNAMVS